MDEIEIRVEGEPREGQGFVEGRALSDLITD